MKQRVVNRKLIILIDIILLIVSIICYKYIYKVEIGKRIYSEETEKFVEENKEPIFRIGKIILYSSANAIDNSEGKLQNIDISQFTDIELYVDNKIKNKELTAENTINKLYIDNIKINCNSDSGEKIFNYKNPLNCGKYVDLVNYSDDKIMFEIPNSNRENEEASYEENTFYTDCSNPISLGYINKNILTGCEVNGSNASLAFDGSILKTANVPLDKLKSTLSFSIHLVNNYDEEFVCNLIIDNDLDNEDEGIYTGYIMKVIDTEDEKYNFLKVK